MLRPQPTAFLLLRLHPSHHLRFFAPLGLYTALARGIETRLKGST